MCSGYAILVHCDQVQEIGWERKPHGENCYLLQTLKLQQATISQLQTNGHITKAYLFVVYIQKNCIALYYCVMFTTSFDPDST